MSNPIRPTPCSVSSFQIEKFAPPRLRANDRFEYVLRVTNTGKAQLEGAVLVEALVSTITILECSPSPQVSDKHHGRWSIGNVPPGEYREVRIQATCDQDMAFRSHSSLSCASHA